MKRLLLIIVSLFSLIACSQKPVITFEMMTPAPAITATPSAVGTLATPTPWVAGTRTARVVSAEQTQSAATVVNQVLPTFAFPASTSGGSLEKPADFSPVLYGKKYDANTFFLLLGGVGRDTWLAPDVSVKRFAGEATYGLHTFKIVNHYFFWGKSPEFHPTCKAYTIGTDIDVSEAGMVATLDGWSITQGAVTELSADGQFYQQVVTDWLTAEGLSAPQIGDLRIFRVDLEGDGTDEIFISATHLDGSQHATKAGDYSVVLMRKVVANDAVTMPLVADFYISKESEITFPRTYSIGNFIDLNQDGVMEVVVDIRKWEGFGASVYQIDGQNVTEALRAEC